MDIRGQATIFKNDKGVYKTSLMNKETTPDGEEKSIFMQVNVGFKKGVEVKNKTRIEIKEGFLTFFRIKTDNILENGEPEYKRYPKIMVMDFDIIEDGIDEVYHAKDYSNTQSNFSDDTFGGYYSSSDDLPF